MNQSPMGLDRLAVILFLRNQSSLAVVNCLNTCFANLTPDAVEPVISYLQKSLFPLFLIAHHVNHCVNAA